jgi:hypothetical protein
MAVSKCTLSFLDKQSKTGSVGFYTTLMSAANFTALNTLIDNAVAAVEAITLLEKQKDERLSAVAKFSVTPPTADFALKGIRWLVRGVDSNGNSVSMQIPGADLSLSADGKTLDLTAGAGAALKTALDAVWKSNDGETVVTQEVIYLDK